MKSTECFRFSASRIDDPLLIGDRSLIMKKIVGGIVVIASDTFAADVFVEGGKVIAMFMLGTVPANADTIDAKGCYLIFGGIDVHTHFDMLFGGTTSSDDFESGTIAAAHGGTTTIIDFAIQVKGTSLKGALDTWHK